MASGPEYHEGPDAARRFERTLSRLISVSKDELGKREASERKSRLRKRNRPKPTK